MSTKREVRKLPTRQNIIEIRYSGNRFSRQRIAHEIERIRTAKPNRRFQVLLPYETWKPGSWFQNDEEISLFTLYDHYDEGQIPENYGDPEYYDNFIIYMTDSTQQAGGCNNELNDCLYQCLYYAYGTFSNLPKAIETPELLKEVLGLQRNDLIPVKLIEKVEQLAKTIAIDIIGDAIYKSKNKAYRKITLVLTNSHYSIAINKERRKVEASTAKLKKPLIYQQIIDNQESIVKIYDGKVIRNINLLEFRKLQSKSIFGKWCFIPVIKDKKTGIYETLEEAYIRIQEERNILLNESKKLGLKIDLFMCHGSYKKVALWLFERLSQSIPANEKLDAIEAKWISDTMMGGLIYAENNWQGDSRQYDCTSLYPSIMQSTLTFPIGKGRFDTLQDFVNCRGFYIYGIFHASVNYSEDAKKLFRYNKYNKYTHIDLAYARKLGLQVNLIQDNTPNALIYEKEARIPGKVMFGEYVNFLFRLKNKSGIISKVAKRILNTLWGALCQRNKFYYNISTTNDKLFDNKDEVLESIIPINEDSWMLQYSNPANLFKGEYPRIAPFILAQGRKIVSSYIEPYKNYVKRIHTDGFILSEDLTKQPLLTIRNNASHSLMALKFEKEGKCYVKNANQVTWL